MPLRTEEEIRNELKRRIVQYREYKDDFKQSLETRTAIRSGLNSQMRLLEWVLNEE